MVDAQVMMAGIITLAVYTPVIAAMEDTGSGTGPRNVRSTRQGNVM